MSGLSEEDLELLDNVVNGNATAAEADAVRANIDASPAWREAYTLRIDARKAVQKQFHGDMRTVFQTIDRSEGNSRIRIKPLWLGLAAGVALMISVLFWLLPEKGSDQLAAAYTKFPNIVLPIQKSADTPSLREQAYHAYERNDFVQAEALFSGLEAPATEDSVYFGLASLETGSFANAGKLLEPVSRGQGKWAEVAQWYLIWVYLGQDHPAAARAQLKMISNTPRHRYQARAQDIASKL